MRASSTFTAMEISVGGTLMSSNVPDMESLPPMDGMPSLSCAVSAPSSDASGRPHFSGSLFRRSKNSWKVSRIVRTSPPAAAILDADSTTAYSAPWNGDQVDRYGS